jgi:hypothetical protein
VRCGRVADDGGERTARGCDVVGVDRLAGNVQMRRLVALRHGDGTACEVDVLLDGIVNSVHAAPFWSGSATTGG